MPMGAFMERRTIPELDEWLPAGVSYVSKCRADDVARQDVYRTRVKGVSPRTATESRPLHRVRLKSSLILTRQDGSCCDGAKW